MVDTRPSLLHVLRRVVTRPRPWAVRYVLLTLSASLLALGAGLAALPWFRFPLLAEALETRSLDLLLELILAPVNDGAGTGKVALALVVIVLAWLPMRLLWWWTEGGVLATYASAEALTSQAFRQACRRWFGVMLRFMLLRAASIIAVVGLALLGILLTRRLPAGGGIVPAIAYGAAAMIGMGSLWIETARAAAIVQDEPSIYRALSSAARLIGAAPLRWMTIVGLSLAGQAAASLLQRGLTRNLPLTSWLVVLAGLQLLQIIRLGLRLARQAGEIGLALLETSAPGSTGTPAQLQTDPK